MESLMLPKTYAETWSRGSLRLETGLSFSVFLFDWFLEAAFTYATRATFDPSGKATFE